MNDDFGKYELKEVLGKGASATVYRALVRNLADRLALADARIAQLTI